MALKRITAPADLLTLDQAKAHLRVDFADDDTLISALIDAATGYVDGPKGFLGRALLDQTWDFYLDVFPSNQVIQCGPGQSTVGLNAIEIPLPPLIEVVGVFYLDSSGNEQQLSASAYSIDAVSEPARIVLASSGSWPSIKSVANAVRIRFRSGYLDQGSPPVENVPFPIKAAILLHIGDLYANRETMIVGTTVYKLPWAAEQLLRPHRVYLSMA